VPKRRPHPHFRIAFAVPWSTPFEDPIILPDGRQLLTLKDAADYINKLPKQESDLPEWQTAIEALMLCSRGGPTMMARIGVMKALNRHVERVFNPDRKETLGEAEAQEGPMTVLIYVDTSKQIGDPDHLRVFANADAADIVAVCRHVSKVPETDSGNEHVVVRAWPFPTNSSKIKENWAEGDREVHHSAALSDRNNRRRLHGGFRCPEWRCDPCRFE
jgi:hypothetical protein